MSAEPLKRRCPTNLKQKRPKMDELIIHQSTREHLKRFLAAPHHAVLLAGPNGIGKTTIAELLAAQLLQIPRSKLPTFPYFSLIEATPSGAISIETVRKIQKFLQLKTMGSEAYRRIIIVEHADGLTVEAQNALLKVLEEPPADTAIILTVESKRSLLPTIVSRMQTVPVLVPDMATLQTFFAKDLTSESAFTQAYFLSGGLPGLMSSLLNQDTEHPLLAGVTTAKDLLQKTPFERLATVDMLVKQKDTLGSTLEALLRISLSGLQQATSKQEPARLKQWHRIRKEVQAAQAAIGQSANSKLVLTKMLLHL
jgi:DNA polymerase-3 subunit delta'